MDTISERTIHISHEEYGIAVSFSWYVPENEAGNRFNAKSVMLIDEPVLDEFRKFLNSLKVDWFVANATKRRLAFSCTLPAILSPLFDVAVKTDNPLLTFITPFEILPQPQQETAHVS